MSSERKVLIVDDIPVNQKLLAMYLRKFGVESDMAYTGADAIHCYRSNKYSLILMDLDMPVLNGIQATAEIRKLEKPLGVHTPIVAVTSFDRNWDRTKCLEAGMDDFIPKGATLDELRRLIDRYVFGKQDAGAPVPPKAVPQEQLEVDLAWLQEKLGKDRGDLIPLFLGSASMVLYCLELALNSLDVTAADKLALQLKGTCSTIGLEKMAHTTDELAKSVEKGDWHSANTIYQQLVKMFNAIEEQAAKQKA